MNEFIKRFHCSCVVSQCPVHNNKDLKSIYCGNPDLCEKLEVGNTSHSDRDFLFKYRIF